MTREATLARALVELADTLVADHDPLEYLYTLVERCVEVLNATAAGALLLSASSLELAAATSPELRVLGVLDVEQRAGPCCEAYATGSVVSEPDLAGARGRWPAFSGRALELGYRGVQAHPLRLRDERLGALNVFSSEPGRFSAGDEVAAKSLADMASIGIAHRRALSAAHEQIHHLRQALEHRAVVEQAKVLLAERLGTDTGAAFDRLRHYARNGNHRLRDVAQRLVDGELDAHDVVHD